MRWTWRRYLGVPVRLELHAELLVGVEHVAEFRDLLVYLGRVSRDALILGRLLDEFLLDHQVHRLDAQLLQQFELVAARADLHAFRVAVLDIEALEALVAYGLVINAHGVAGVDALRLRRARYDAEHQQPGPCTNNQLTASVVDSSAAGTAIRLKSVRSE
jgi:hypothetical protein